MKKIKLILFIILSFLIPLNIKAYSPYIIPGGESVGIEIKTDGILIVGFYKIDGKLNKNDLKVGDRIIEVENNKVNSIDEMINLMEKNIKNNKVNITYKRNEKIKTTELELINKDGSYKTGLYVKDSITGIGTLTYIDPESKIYGALGHEIIESTSNHKVEVRNGSIFRSSITSIDRSVTGTPGGKNAQFYTNTTFGTIDKNSISGIYGKFTSKLPKTDSLKVADIREVTTGKAYIYTVLNGETKEKFEINITKIDKDSQIKNLYFEVIDKKLLEKTGGIVQGMSGSPIIQNNMIIGAVTHVVVSSPTNGYGINITKMLEEGEK